MAEEKEGEKKRGPKGGIKHTPGGGHARKSQPSKKRRIGKRLRDRHKEREEEARREHAEYDKLPDEVKKLLGEKGKPKVRRPKNES